jgi:hypothetical protein
MGDPEAALRHTMILFDLGPRINREFNGPSVADLIDPAIVVLVENGRQTIHVVERIQLAAALSGESFNEVSGKNEHPIAAAVFSGEGTFTYSIPDPRVVQDWWRRRDRNE